MPFIDRMRGVAVGAAIGDALGMPLEFRGRIPRDRLVREMQDGRLPAGSFTDDTEMALALADSLVEHAPLDPANLAQHFLAWYRHGPEDVGNQTRAVLARLAAGDDWERASRAGGRNSAGNGSVMRCWPVALVWCEAIELLIRDSELQSQVTHPHEECVAASAFVNVMIYHLVKERTPREALEYACTDVALPQDLLAAIRTAAGKSREELPNTGWVRHTVESAVWGLLTTDSFEEAVVQVANLGNDADTAASVAGALAGAAYGLSGIPARWRRQLQGRWPIGHGDLWDEQRFVGLADRLMAL